MIGYIIQCADSNKALEQFFWLSKYYQDKGVKITVTPENNTIRMDEDGTGYKFIDMRTTKITNFTGYIMQCAEFQKIMEHAK